MNIDSLLKQAQAFLVPALISLAKAIVVWYIGRWAIGFGVSLMRKSLTHNKLDATLVRYICSIVNSLLTVLLALGVISIFGVETTSFAALAAGAGLAIGAAWSGMLSNFAAGVFMIVMRPFKVGDEVEAGGCSGTVREIGLFATQIDTGEKVYTLVGNSKLFEGKISNFSANPVRVCSIKFSLPSGTPFRQRLEALRTKLQAIPHVEPNSAEVRVIGIDGGPVLEAATECHQEHWEDVRCEMADIIDLALGDLGFGAAPAGEGGEEGEGGLLGEVPEAEGGEEEGDEE